MLIVTRNIGESIIIKDDIKVTIVAIKGNQVKVGVDAPEDITVHREEIYERIKKEEKAKNPKNEDRGDGNTTK